MSDIESLRTAASLMRWRARRAAPGPWRPVDGLWQTETFAAVLPPGGKADDASTWLVATGKRPPGSVSPQADADHIASWSPPVALAVADWLDARAAEYDEVTSGPYGPAAAAFVAGGDADPAVTLARIYLGKSDDQPAT